MWTVPTAGSVQSNGALESVQAPTVMEETATASPSTGSLSPSSTPKVEGVVVRTCGVATAPTSTRSSVLPMNSKLSLSATGGSLMQVTNTETVVEEPPGARV